MNPSGQQCEAEFLRTSLKEATILLSKKESEILQMRADLEGKLEHALSRLNSLQEQYDLLLVDHHRLIKLNHELEDRLLNTIETVNSETAKFSEELENTTGRLRSCENELSTVIAERDRLKEDCSTAVSLLQANPGHFISSVSKVHKVHPTPHDMRSGQQPLSLSPAFLPTFPPVGVSSAFHIGSYSDQNGTSWFVPDNNNLTGSNKIHDQPLHFRSAKSGDGAVTGI